MTPGKKKDRKKTIKGYAVVDWKKEKIRSRQTEPSAGDLGTNELLAELRFDVTIPDVDVPTLAAEIEVPEPMVYSATLEALEDREMPDYAKVADKVITTHVDAIQEADEHDDSMMIEDLIARITIQTLREARGRPKLELVEDYINVVVAEIRDEGEPQQEIIADT